MTTHFRRARLVRLAALLLGLGLLALSLVSGVVTSRGRVTAEVDGSLVAGLTEQAGALQDYFERARSIDLLTASNPSFRDFYAAPGTTVDKIRAGGPLMQRIDDALLELEKLYPGRIGEACLIDSGGQEIARAVDGTVAETGDLSDDESQAPFFAPTFALDPGHVYQGRPYVSPDTGEWVISNSTPIAGPAGIAAIVHFEVTLNSFRADDSHYTTSILDADSGSVVLDSRIAQRGTEALGRPGTTELAALVRSGQETGKASIGGERVAFRRLQTGADNANNWYLVVTAPDTTSSWTSGIGGGPLALLLAATLLLGFAGASLRGYQKALRAAALNDALTGLPKRELLLDRAGQALRTAQRSGGMVALLLIDLDRFKDVNDTLGHHHGDLLLQQVAARLSTALRASDTVARLGGDEFAVLLPQVLTTEEAQRAAERLLATLHESFLVDDVTLDVEASIGIALAPAHGAEPELLLRRADVAMYQAKEHKIGFALYDVAQDLHTPTRLLLLGDLRRALEVDDQLELHYQPKVDPVRHELHGAEALLRWNHPDRGMVMPGEFLPLVENTALINPLTMRVLEMALAQARAWMESGKPIPVAVNLSTRCLVDKAFPEAVLESLRSSGVPASLLCLEITESAIMSNPDTALWVLDRLHEAGIKLSIDDFGTGYSSMSYLKRLPVDELKVDRSFVKEMIRESSDAVLVRSAVELGHNLGLVVVAEGVEDGDTLSALRDVACDYVQGYHLGRPMPVAKFDAWLLDEDARLPLPVVSP
jgi:diguanylate cyclase (GGDEF)-like protein